MVKNLDAMHLVFFPFKTGLYQETKTSLFVMPKFNIKLIQLPKYIKYSTFCKLKVTAFVGFQMQVLPL